MEINFKFEMFEMPELTDAIKALAVTMELTAAAKVEKTQSEEKEFEAGVQSAQEVVAEVVVVKEKKRSRTRAKKKEISETPLVEKEEAPETPLVEKEEAPEALKPDPIETDRKEEIEEAKPQTVAPVLTLEKVRASLAKLSKAGKAKQIKEILASFKATKLTDIPAEKYSELMAKAEEIA